jgi:hypothetical protein
MMVFQPGGIERTVRRTELDLRGLSRSRCGSSYPATAWLSRQTLGSLLQALADLVKAIHLDLCLNRGHTAKTVMS